MLVARPLAVLACLSWFRQPWQDLTLVSWAGLRGAVPIVLATFPFAAGYPQGDLIFDMVFFVVLLSALVQGGSVGLVAKWLNLRAEGRAWAPTAGAVPISDINAELIEVRVTEDLHLAGQQLKDIHPPRGLITSSSPRRGTRRPPATSPPGLAALQPHRSRATGATEVWIQTGRWPNDVGGVKFD